MNNMEKSVYCCRITQISQNKLELQYRNKQIFLAAFVEQNLKSSFNKRQADSKGPLRSFIPVDCSIFVRFKFH